MDRYERWGKMIDIEKKEKESQVEVIMVQGMSDMGSFLNHLAAAHINATAFDPGWTDKKDEETGDNLEKKLGRLGKIIDQAREENKVVVLVGISAGAGLAELLMLKRGIDSGVRHLYSVGGVLSPNLNSPDKKDKEKWKVLRKDHMAFTQMIEELYFILKDPEAVRLSGVRDKVTVYKSPEDEVVTQEALAPDWVKKVKDVNNSTHLGSIVGALVGDIKKKTDMLKKANFK